jgi:hypothetical protein
MKKINGTAILFSILFMMTPFVLPAQERATVTVTIKNLRAISSDACGDMDFFAKIRIGGKLKTFPVREGDNITVNWQFTATTALDSVTTLIEIWDDDEAFCGEADDEVCVSGNSKRVFQKFGTREYKNENFSSDGTCNRGGTENGHIEYNITIVPVKTKIQLLTQRNWKIVATEKQDNLGRWSPAYLASFSFASACEKDNCYVFSSKGIYEQNEGTTKCSSADPQIIKTGTWRFQSNETKILLNITGSPSDAAVSVDQLDENKLKLTFTHYKSGLVLSRERITYGH